MQRYIRGSHSSWFAFAEGRRKEEGIYIELAKKGSSGKEMGGKSASYSALVLTVGRGRIFSDDGDVDF